MIKYFSPKSIKYLWWSLHNIIEKALILNFIYIPFRSFFPNIFARIEANPAKLYLRKVPTLFVTFQVKSAYADNGLFVGECKMEYD